MDPTAYELTLEQQFQMRLMTESAQAMDQAQLKDLLIQASRLLLVKDNVLKNLMQQAMPGIPAQA